LFVGGALRWLADRYWFKQPGHANLTPEQFAAESDKSPGVLLSSGYIACGAIAGIIIAFVQGGLTAFDTRLTKWAEANNPLFEGPWSDALSLIPFAAICLILFLVSRGKLLAT